MCIRDRDIGPTGKLLEPLGTLSFEEALKAFAETVKLGVDVYKRQPQYCSGYLDASLTHNANHSTNTVGFKYLWKSEDRFDNIDFPVLWLQWTKDTSAAITSTTLCYLATEDVSQMVLRMNWGHGHDWTCLLYTSSA